MTNSFTVLALTAVLLATPAAGQTQLAANGANDGAAVQDKAAPAQRQPAGKEKMYCLKDDTVTGTRVAKPECRTKADWAQEGVDIDALVNKKR